MIGPSVNAARYACSRNSSSGPPSFLVVSFSGFLCGLLAHRILCRLQLPPPNFTASSALAIPRHPRHVAMQAVILSGAGRLEELTKNLEPKPGKNEKG